MKRKQKRISSTTTKKAAIYCRVSTAGQEEDGTSLDTQEARCRQYATTQGYTVEEAHVYREVYTGTEL
jgi:site-specific DNA recombinase